MIIYNIRANGPYEYDKFMLIFGQLHNLYIDTQTLWENSAAKEQDKILSDMIRQITDPDFAPNRIAILKGLVRE